MRNPRLSLNVPDCGGIYYILNTANQCIYIGRAAHIGDRWVSHNQQLRANGHHNQALQFDWNLYGPDVFEWGVLCSELGGRAWAKGDPEYGRKNRDRLDTLERTFFRVYQSTDPRYGYNLKSSDQLYFNKNAARYFH